MGALIQSRRHPGRPQADPGSREGVAQDFTAIPAPRCAEPALGLAEGKTRGAGMTNDES